VAAFERDCVFVGTVALLAASLFMAHSAGDFVARNASIVQRRNLQLTFACRSVAAEGLDLAARAPATHPANIPAIRPGFVARRVRAPEAELRAADTRAVFPGVVVWVVPAESAGLQSNRRA